MSEVKTRGAPDRIWTQLDYSVIPFQFSRECSDEKSSDDDIEYIRAEIARELAEALQMAVDDDEIASLENSGSISRTRRTKIRTALAKWREATEETE